MFIGPVYNVNNGNAGVTIDATNSTQFATQGTGFTFGINAWSGMSVAVTTEHKRVTGSGGVAATFTAPSSQDWITFCAVFKEAAAGFPPELFKPAPHLAQW